MAQTLFYCRVIRTFTSQMSSKRK